MGDVEVLNIEIPAVFKRMNGTNVDLKQKRCFILLMLVCLLMLISADSARRVRHLREDRG